MSRVVRVESPTRSRSRLIAAAHATLAAIHAEPATDDLRDQLAFLVLALRGLTASVEATALAWERRDYWLKADQFRREWAWAAAAEKRIGPAVLAGDLSRATREAERLAERMPAPKKPSARTAAPPWAGAYDRLRSQDR